MTRNGGTDLDRVVRGGTVVDGTGAPGRRADVGIRDGRVVADRRDRPSRRRRAIDADGPDRRAPASSTCTPTTTSRSSGTRRSSPSPFHGVTTVIGGNCGFSVAPLGRRDGDYLMRMLARVEGMPLAALDEADRLGLDVVRLVPRPARRPLAPNVGFLVGHSAVRRAVMGEAGSEREATDDEVAAMAGCSAPAWPRAGSGFSSSWAATHNDAAGDPVPSRFATEDELLALCARSPPRRHDARVHPRRRHVHRARGRAHGPHVGGRRPPLNWNVLIVMAGLASRWPSQLARANARPTSAAGCSASRCPARLAPAELRVGLPARHDPGLGRSHDAPPDEEALLASPEGRAS